MPALPTVAKTVRLAFEGLTGADTPWVTRTHYTYAATAPTATDLNTFCESCATLWETDVSPWMHENDTLTNIVAVDLSSDTAAEGSYTDTIAGELTGDQLPGDTAMIVSYTILRRYRGGHPRGYWRVGNGDAVINPSEWDPTFLGNAGGGVSLLLAGITGAGWAGAGTINQTNVSYYSGFTAVENPLTLRYRNVPKLRVGGPVIDVVTGYIPREPLGSQRRRQKLV